MYKSIVLYHTYSTLDNILSSFCPIQSILNADEVQLITDKTLLTAQLRNPLVTAALKTEGKLNLSKVAVMRKIRVETVECQGIHFLIKTEFRPSHQLLCW